MPEIAHLFPEGKFAASDDTDPMGAGSTAYARLSLRIQRVLNSTSRETRNGKRSMRNAEARC